MIEAALLGAAGITLVWLAIWDFRTHRLPDALNAVFAALGAALYLWNGGVVSGVADLLWAAGCGAGLLYAVGAYFQWRTGREGLGLGDVKYIAAAGIWVGPERIFIVIAMGAVLTLAVVLGQRLVRRQPMRMSDPTVLPFGPGLIAATAIVFCSAYF